MFSARADGTPGWRSTNRSSELWREPVWPAAGGTATAPPSSATSRSSALLPTDLCVIVPRRTTYRGTVQRTVEPVNRQPSVSEHRSPTPTRRPTPSDRGGRGTRARNSLSRELIADTALDLVDREGVEALTMRRLARELDVGTMTLYGYFRDKDELLDHALDRGARRYDLSPGEGEWRPRLRELITTIWRSLNEHPSAVQIRSRRPILNPGALRACEAGMTILHEAGFETPEAAAAWRLLFTYAFGYAAFSSYEPSAELKSEWREQLSALPADRYPITSGGAGELVNWMAGSEPFEQGLEIILDGLEARLSS